jgi:hypothetical protein
MASKGTKKKRVGKGRAGVKASQRATATESSTKEFPQVGDAIRTHRGAASGWSSGNVEYRTEHGSIVARLSDGTTLGLEKGQYEPADGFLPPNRTFAETPPAVMSMPAIGPPGPVMGKHTSGGAGQTLPQGRFHEPRTEGRSDQPKNPGPIETAGPAPALGEQLGPTPEAGPPPAHPTGEQAKLTRAEKARRKELEAQNVAAGRATGR